MKKLLACGLLCVMGALGCGGDGGIDEGPSASEGTPNLVAMRAAVMTADRLRLAVAAGNGGAISGAAISLSNTAMSAVRPKSITQPLVEEIAQAQTVNPPGTTGTANCTPAGCTFDNYTMSGFSISGTVTASDAGNGASHVVWSLNGKQATSNSLPPSSGVTVGALSYKFRGDMTLSPTSATGAAGGDASGSGTVQGQSFTASQGNILKLLDVQLMDGCPTAGNVFAKWWQTAHVSGQSQSQAFQATQAVVGCR
jgi:hypothetical protein